VTFFFGLDVVALYIAFRINFRDAAGFEEVAVSPLKVQLAKVTPKGERAEWRFDTLFTKLERQDDKDYGLMRLRCRLARAIRAHRAGPVAGREGELS
jgi:uncharacterized membrane protein